MYHNKLTFHVALVFVLGLISTNATAASISLNPAQTGSISKGEIYTSNGPLPPTMTSSSPLESFRYSPASPLGSVKYRSNGQGYLLFDLSNLPYDVESASLEFNLDYARSAAPNLTITGLDLLQAQDLLNVPPGTESWSGQVFLTGTPDERAAYNRLSSGYSAISSGTELGTLTDSGPLNGLYNIDLNSEALSFINSSSGLLGLGLTWTPTVDIVEDPIFGPWEDGYDTLTFNAAPILVLNTVSEVPLPAAAWLFGSAIFGLGAVKRKSQTPLHT